MKRGAFITLEGGEGAGKSTVLAAIRDCLDRHRIAHRCTREPGGTPLGEALRALVLDPQYRGVCAESEVLMMFASRAQLVRELVEPALAHGEWVLSDRFTDASFAYQGGGRGIARSVLDDLERWAAAGLKPDRTFLLDVPVDEGLRRAAARGAPADRMERESVDFFERVRAAYRERAAAEPARFVVIDAGQALPQVVSEVRRGVEELIHQWPRDDR
jgi:dTMP kinase